MGKTESWEDAEIKKLKKKGKKYFRDEVPSAPIVTVINNVAAPDFSSNTADYDLERLRNGR